jgi:hypothetical protein
MNHTFKVYAIYFCAPLMALSALANGLNATKYSSVASDANSRVQILQAAMPNIPKAQKPPVQSSINLANLKKDHYNGKAFSSVAWLLLDLGLLTYCLVKLNQYNTQDIPSAPGND